MRVAPPNAPDLLAELLNVWTPQRQSTRRRGSESWTEYHTACPYCGKEAKRGDKHFSFSQFGGYCQVCGQGEGLVRLARFAGVLDNVERPDSTLIHHREKRYVNQWVEPWWWRDRLFLLNEYQQGNVIEKWGEYKPLSEKTISTWGLGWGRLPAARPGRRMKTPRLIVPVWDNQNLVAMMGRKLVGGGPKWILAPDAKETRFLFGKDYLIHRRDRGRARGVVLVENAVDALLANERWGHEGWVFLKPSQTGLVAEWRKWAHLFEGLPVVVAFDYDLVGLDPSHPYRRKLVHEWKQKNLQRSMFSQKSAPRAVGRELRDRLRGMGLEAYILHQWGEGARRGESSVDGWIRDELPSLDLLAWSI